MGSIVWVLVSMVAWNTPGPLFLPLTDIQVIHHAVISL